MRRCPSCEKSEFELRYPCSGTRKLTLRKCGNLVRAASHPDQSTEHKLYDSSAVRIVTALRFGAIRWARMPKACLKMPVANRGTSRVSTLRALQGKRFSSARSSSGSRTEGGLVEQKGKALWRAYECNRGSLTSHEAPSTSIYCSHKLLTAIRL